MEKYFHEPYDLDNVQPELTTMPTNPRQKVLSPGQVVEVFIRGTKNARPSEQQKAQTPDNRLMIMRNNSLIISDCDMVSARAMMTRYELANDQVLILKTISMTSIYEKFVTTYCERSHKVAAVLESPLTRDIPGASTQEVVVKHFNRLVNDHDWTTSAEEGRMLCALVFRCAMDHVGKFGAPPAGFRVSDHIRNAYFNTDSYESLHDDLRVHRAMEEIAR